jgi:tetraacyldisaccharide 4''-kinase
MDPLKLQKQLSPILKPISGLYGAAMRARHKAWETSSSRYACDCPCVSVGNIAWGGTGKTPIVEWLMHWAAAERLRGVVLSRGYGAKIQNPPVRILSRHAPWEVGDEPLMLALSCPAVPVLVDPERRRSADWAMQHMRPQLVLLDDGFQHVALARDLDLVLLRPNDLRDEWNRVIPAGSWRESADALERAGAFLIKCSPDELHALAPSIVTRLERFGKPVFSFQLVPRCLRRVGGSETLSAPELIQHPYILLTGVGEPEQVKHTVADFMGYDPLESIFKPDHHRFAFDEVQALAHRRHMVICTAKDAVKLRMLPAPNFWYLETDVRFGPAVWAEQNFPEWWEAWWRSHTLSPQPDPVVTFR